MRIAWIGLLAGCVGEPEAEPSLVIASPADESTVCGTPLEVVLEVENFDLVPIVEGSQPKPGSGHVDVYLNGQSALMAETESFALDGLEDGLYQLRADLVRADHEALDPYVGDFVYVTVSAAACGP